MAARPALPVLLMLVYPGPAAARPAVPPPLRASDVDRDIAADILCAAVADGRLTLEELDGRLGAALSARTLPELAALIADLPDRPLRSPEPATRWSLIQSMVDARSVLNRVVLPDEHCAVGHPRRLGSMRARRGAITSAA